MRTEVVSVFENLSSMLARTLLLTYMLLAMMEHVLSLVYYLLMAEVTHAHSVSPQTVPFMRVLVSDTLVFPAKSESAWSAALGPPWVLSRCPDPLGLDFLSL